MKRSAWLALGVVLLSNAVALGGVWYNRSGEPETQLLLSERELQRVYGGWLRDEDDGVLRLQLSWQRPGEGWQLPWLDEAKLHELGYSATDEQALRRQRSGHAQALLLMLPTLANWSRDPQLSGNGGGFTAALERG